MKLHLSILATALLSTFSFSALAASGNSAAAQVSVPQCSGELATPLYHCINLAGAPDVRLYVQEFQTCENGKITELDRSVSASFFTDTDSDLGEPEIIKDITFAPNRTVVPDRGDQLTMIMPTSATILAKGSVFKFKMTTVVEDNYRNAPAEQQHYVGSFEQLTAGGKVIAAGKLACFID